MKRTLVIALLSSIVVIFAMRCDAQTTVVGTATASTSARYDCWYPSDHIGACYLEKTQDHHGCTDDYRWIMDSRGGKCYQRVSKDLDIPGWHIWTVSADSDELRMAGIYSCWESDRGIDCERRTEKILLACDDGSKPTNDVCTDGSVPQELHPTTHKH